MDPRSLTVLCLLKAPPNKGPPVYGLGIHYTVHNDENRLGMDFLKSGPIFNPKPLLERSEPQLLPCGTRFDLATAPRPKNLGIILWSSLCVDFTLNHPPRNPNVCDKSNPHIVEHSYSFGCRDFVQAWNLNMYFLPNPFTHLSPMVCIHDILKSNIIRINTLHVVIVV